VLALNQFLKQTIIIWPFYEGNVFLNLMVSAFWHEATDENPKKFCTWWRILE